jgi:predicted nucleic acid-binding protein
MTGHSFLDTNILVYAYDPSEPRKQKIAQDLVKGALKGQFLISVQVLAEFTATLLHKVAVRRTADEVTVILDILAPIRCIGPDSDIVRRAVEAHGAYGVHFYDGMIIAAAERAGSEKIWSEDLNTAQKYFGVSVANPFV